MHFGNKCILGVNYDDNYRHTDLLQQTTDILTRLELAAAYFRLPKRTSDPLDGALPSHCAFGSAIPTP